MLKGPKSDDWLFDYIRAKIEEQDALMSPLEDLIENYNDLKSDEITQELHDANEINKHRKAVLNAKREAYYDVMCQRVFHV